MWSGPPQFLYAPGGWTVQRRPAGPFNFHDVLCNEVSGTTLTRLRLHLEIKLDFGWIRLSPGVWNGPDPGACEIFTIDLERPATNVSGSYRGQHGFAIGLHHGKAVAFQFLLLAHAGRNFAFGAVPIDQIVVYGLQAQSLNCCIAENPGMDGLVTIAQLHLPLREFMPDLTSENDEFLEAQRRLAPGESIDPQRFKELANILRVALRGPGRRPIDNLLRMQNESGEPEEMFALDPLRTLLASPKWRRVMGLGWLDRDPALQPGTSYDYHITGRFPLSARESRVFGFHTIPPGTTLPQDFTLHDCRFRLPQPTIVEAAPSIPASGEFWVTRSGIRIQPRTGLSWFGSGIDDFSLSVDLPFPVTKITLELDAGHQLRYTGGDPGGTFTDEKPVTNPLLEFSAPITQLNLRGNGFLFAVRLNDGTDRFVETRAILPGVKFEETPRPPEPQEVEITNLQRASTLSTGTSSIRKLHPVGMQIRWRPGPTLNLPFWPTGMQAPSPLDATMFQAERHVEPSGPYGPVLAGEDNSMFGSRNEPEIDETVHPGVDLMQLFPEEVRPVPSGNDFFYTDVFRAPTEENPAHRDAPAPGSVLRYRVRTLDAIGRPSLLWRDSNTERLEKHEPPPPPTAYDPIPADQLTTPGPTGVYARVLVQGAPDLTPEETALLGLFDNVIVLRWGWHDRERSQDPFAQHFRVYIAPTLDLLPGEIVSVTEDTEPGNWLLQIRVDQTLKADGAAGLFLNAGYPFLIVTHTEGPLVNMRVRTRIPDASGSFRRPALGSVNVPLKLSPGMTRPQLWSERFIFPTGHAFMPITAATQYQAVIPNRLILTPDHPRDAVWVGVTAADAEPYVPDTFFSPGLPGNESTVAVVLCQARHSIRPEFNPPAPAGPVTRVVAPEPVSGPIRFQLDLTPFVASDLSTGELSQPERTSVSALFAALRVVGNSLWAAVVDRRNPDERDEIIILPNPDDNAAIIAAVKNGFSSALEDRLAAHLITIHPYRNRLFKLATTAPVPFGSFEEILPPTEERYLYRFRRADSSNRLSVPAAFANAIVRVPSLAPGAAPRRSPRQSEDPPNRLRLNIPLDTRLSHVITFEHQPTQGAVAGEAELLRVPNRADLGPGMSIRLRLPTGEVLEPFVQMLGTPDADGWSVSVDAMGPAGSEVMIRASTLTSDGVPSPVSGPWKVKIPKP